MKIHSVFDSLVIFSLLLLAAGCGQTAGDPAGASKGRVIGVSFQTMNNPFFVDLNAGIRAVVESHGDRLVTLDAQFDSLKQKNDISDLILQDAAAVFINPVNWEGIRGSLTQAKQKNTPCIVVDAPAKDVDLALTTVASDNVEAGRLAAQALVKARPKARIVILHLSTNKACIDRVAGFREEVEKHPDMKILDVQEGKGTVEGGRPVMRDLLARFPELDAAFPVNEPSALGAISALESAGKLEQVAVVSVDGSPEGLAAIRSGKLLATAAQFPKEIGRRAAEKLYAHLAGKPVEKDIKVPVQLITKDNVDAFQKKE